MEEAHFFDFPESQLHGTILRLQEPQIIPVLCMLSTYLVETGDQTIVLRLRKVEKLGSQVEFDQFLDKSEID